MTATVLNKQSLFDIAIQTAGSAEAAFALALANDKSLTDELIVGEPVIPSLGGGGAFNRLIANYYDAKQLKPATAATDEQFSEILGEGIGFMGIEIDFIVS